MHKHEDPKNQSPEDQFSPTKQVRNLQERLSHEQMHQGGPAMNSNASAESRSSKFLREFLLRATIVAGLLLILAIYWYLESKKLSIGTKLVLPSEVSPIGDFFAGTIGVAATFAAAYLGLKLADQALRLAEEQNNTSKVLSQNKDAEDLREVKQHITEDVRKTAELIVALIRSYTEVVSMAERIIGYGELRDMHAKEDIKRLQEKQSTTPSDFTAEDQVALEKARSDDADLKFFSSDDFKTFSDQVSELSRALQDAYWHVPARKLIESQRQDLNDWYQSIKIESFESNFLNPSENPHEFAYSMNDKATIAVRELPFLDSSAKSSRHYYQVVHRTLESATFRASENGWSRHKISNSNNRLRALALVGYSFFGRTFTNSNGSYQVNHGLLMMLMLSGVFPSQAQLVSQMKDRFSSLNTPKSIAQSQIEDLIDEVLNDYDLDHWREHRQHISYLQPDEASQIIFFNPNVVAIAYIQKAQNYVHDLSSGISDSEAEQIGPSVDKVEEALALLVVAYEVATSYETELLAIRLLEQLFRACAVLKQKIEVGLFLVMTIEHFTSNRETSEQTVPEDVLSLERELKTFFEEFGDQTGSSDDSKTNE